MDNHDVPWTQPIASTSRAVYTLPYKAKDTTGGVEGDLGWSRGVEAYRAAWRATHGRIQDTLSTLHDASLDQIVAYVRAPESADAQLYATLSGRALLRTGLIVGASPGSSSLLYSSLVRQLSQTDPDAAAQPATAQSARPCRVSRLASRDCSNIKNALRSLIGGFIGSDMNADLGDDEDEEDEVYLGAPVTRKSEMLVPEDMRNLQAWYENHYGKQDSDSAPTLVVLIEDLEAMDGKVLTQMIDTLSRHTDSLPLTLLVGIATTADALWTLLGRQTANKLDAASFFVDPGVGAFNALMRGLFIDWQAPLALSPRVYDSLWRTFEDLHHSVDASISFIQHLYMSHYVASPAHSLTPSSAGQDDPRALEALKSLPYYSSLPDVTSSEVEKILQGARGAYAAWHAERREAFHVLVAMMDFWDKRKPLEGVLALVLGEGEPGRSIARLIDELCNLVLQASSVKLPSFLRSLLSRLEALVEPADPDDGAPRLAGPLAAFLQTQLSALEPILVAPRPAGRSSLLNTNLAGAFSIPGMGAAAPVDRDFSRLAKETAEGLKQKLRHGFRSQAELALNQLWFTDDRSASKRFLPAPLQSVTRLLNKDDTFAEQDENADPDTTGPSDLHVAYRTYTETHPQGRLANLGEWWGAFELSATDEVARGGAEAADGQAGGRNGASRKRRRADADAEEDDEGGTGEEDSEDEGEDEGPERRKQARFLRAVGDLAHLGFIHPTTYRPEHVLKSVY